MLAQHWIIESKIQKFTESLFKIASARAFEWALSKLHPQNLWTDQQNRCSLFPSSPNQRIHGKYTCDSCLWSVLDSNPSRSSDLFQRNNLWDFLAEELAHSGGENQPRNYPNLHLDNCSYSKKKIIQKFLQ